MTWLYMQNIILILVVLLILPPSHNIIKFCHYCVVKKSVYIAVHVWKSRHQSLLHKLLYNNNIIIIASLYNQFLLHNKLDDNNNIVCTNDLLKDANNNIIYALR